MTADDCDKDASTIPLQHGLHPLLGTRLRSWLKVIRRYGRDLPLTQWARAGMITGTSLASTPARWLDSIRLNGKIDSLKMKPPIFIIGHWRSGTTNFQNHILQDPQWGYVSLLHCLLAPSFHSISNLMRRPIQSRLPSTRAMDQVPIGLDEPMSEDFAMACLSEYTHYHRYFFPNSNREIFDKTILFKDLNEREVDHWYRDYDQLLRKVSIAAGGKQLVLKNPPNTGRIRHLVRYYPDAKFIHVYRNPYSVIASTNKLMKQFLRRFSFQRCSEEVVEENALVDYSVIMNRFFEDEHLIPQENYIEVRYEDVAANGMTAIEAVYDRLKLPGFDSNRERLANYIDSISDYQRNEYRFDESFITRVKEHCEFAIRRWNYEPPS